MVGPFMLVSCMLLVISGGLITVGTMTLNGAVLTAGVVCLALGAGWNGIVFATIQRIGREAKDAKADYVARITGQR